MYNVIHVKITVGTVPLVLVDADIEIPAGLQQLDYVKFLSGRITAIINNSGGDARMRLQSSVPPVGYPHIEIIVGDQYAGQPYVISFGAASVQVSHAGIPFVVSAPVPDPVVKLSSSSTCYRAHRADSCVGAVPVNVVNVYPTCVQCAGPTPPTTGCLDCSSQVIANGVPVMPNSMGDPACIPLGGTVQAAMSSSFETTVTRKVTVHGCSSGTIAFETADVPVESVILDIRTSDGTSIGAPAFVSEGPTGITNVTYSPDPGCNGNDAGSLVEIDFRCSGSMVFSIYRTDLAGGEDVLVHTDQVSSSSSPLFKDSDFVVDDPGLYRIVIEQLVCGRVVRSCAYWVGTCPSVEVSNSGCHEYRISTGTPMPPGNVQVTVTSSIDGSVLSQVDHDALSFPIVVAMPGDGVYLISLKDANGAVHEREVIDLCDLMACRRKLSFRILCEDPCQPATKESMLAREELARITLISEEVERIVRNYRYKYLGVQEYGPSRTASLSYLASVVRAAKKVSARCAKCSDPVVQRSPC